MSSGAPRCAYGSDGVSCARPGYKGGKYCKAHTPKMPKIIKVKCPSCQGIGWFYEGGLPCCCAECHGNGTVERKLVTIQR